MANKQITTVVNFGFNNANRAVETGASTGGLNSPGNYVTITALRNALAAHDAFTYTSAALDRMTVNDMVFAYRSISDPTSIANYMTAQVARTS